MTFKRFEEIPVWQAGIDVGRLVFALTADRAFWRQGDLANQLQRAAVSISNNIAEGFERGTTPELITFIYYARGSAGEVRSMLCLVEGMDRFVDLNSQISALKLSVESISRPLRAWADHLQNSEIRGQRHLNESSRTSYSQAKRSEAFLRKLRQMAPPPGMKGDEGE